MACGITTRLKVCPLAQAQHVCGFALHVRNGFEAATHRFGHVGAAEKAESHDRALFRGPDNAKLRQTEIQEIQLYQQRRVAAEFDVDAHNLLATLGCVRFQCPRR